MTYLLSIDPGVSTGIVLGYFGPNEPYDRLDYWQPKGGLDGFLRWYHSEAPSAVYVARWVSEKFVLRANAFVANVEPVRIEGAMVALGLSPVWQQPAMKAMVPDALLKEHGLWVTGKQVDHTDGRDVNDATIHALAYLKSTSHIATLRAFWPPVEESA